MDSKSYPAIWERGGFCGGDEIGRGGESRIREKMGFDE
jgi:hypothetical protein